jgi:hypothetical protein
MDHLRMLDTGAILYRRVQSGPAPLTVSHTVTVSYALKTAEGVVLSKMEGDVPYADDLCDFASFWQQFSYERTQAALRKITELNMLRHAQVLDIFFHPKNTKVIWDQSYSVRQFVEPPKEGFTA